MVSPILAIASPATHPWMEDTLLLMYPTMALPQPTSLGLHCKVKCSSQQVWLSWEREREICLFSCRATTLDCLSTGLLMWFFFFHRSVHTNLNFTCLCISSHCSVYRLTSPCLCHLSFFSCISGYSPFTSFPSKAVTANPVSELSSPLDLGNCLLLFLPVSHSTCPAIMN